MSSRRRSAFLLFALVSGSCGPVSYLRLDDAVGPAPTHGARGGAHGELVVRTTREEIDRGGPDVYYPHSAYTVVDLRGNEVRRVPNRRTEEDRDPTVVELPAGVYRVRARGLGMRVEITVRIESGRRTELFLHTPWDPPDDAPNLALAYGPRERPIGWNARAASILGLEGELRYEGSSTIAAFIRDSRSVFRSASIMVDDRGESEAGEVAVLGIGDIGGVARAVETPPADVECTVIGYDLIVAVVRTGSSVTELSREDLAGIFSGRITNWSEVGGEEREVAPVLTAEGSATRIVFQRAVLGDATYREGAPTVTRDHEVAERVARSRSLIGQMSLALLGDDDGVRALIIAGQEPSVDNEAYPITRPLNLCIRRDATGAAREFVEWAMSEEGQEVVRRRFMCAMQDGS